MKLQDVSLMPKIKMNTLRAETQKLVKNLIADKWDLKDIKTATGPASANDLYHHTFDCDPAKALGKVDGDVTIYTYYQPSTAHEKKNKGTINREGWRSGRQRLFVRVSERDGASFYVASHPAQKIGGTNDNSYQNWNLVDPTT